MSSRSSHSLSLKSVIIGSNELAERKATVKNMLSGEQQSVAFEEVADLLK